ncbi:MAG: sulfurtransferase TusA family protein [Actinomycetota bacterium]
MTEQAKVLDCLGERCPMPLVHLHELIDAADEQGFLIDVLSDDEGSKVDIPVWCRMRGHEFLGRDDRAEGGWIFHLRTRDQGRP